MNAARIASACTIALVMALVGSCGFFGKRTPTASLQSIRVIADARANAYSATALDVVFVYDAAALAALPKTGPAWFAADNGLTGAFPGALDVVRLEVPPAYALDVQLPARHRKAIRVLVYANYIPAAGQYPIDLTALTRAVIHLKPTAIEVTDG